MNNKYLRMFSPDDTGGTATATAPQAGEGAGETSEVSQVGTTETAPQAQAATPTTSAPSQVEEPQSSPQQQPQKPTRSAEDLEREIDRLRKENAASRIKNKELEDFRKQVELEKLSAQERIERELTDLRAQNEELTKAQVERAIRSEIRLAALELGVKPERLNKVERLVEWEEIQVDKDSGEPTNVRDVLKKLIEEMPELVPPAPQPQRPAPTSSGGATNPARSTTQKPEINRDFVASLTPEKWAQLSREDQIKAAELNIDRWR